MSPQKSYLNLPRPSLRKSKSLSQALINLWGHDEQNPSKRPHPIPMNQVKKVGLKAKSQKQGPLELEKDDLSMSLVAKEQRLKQKQEQGSNSNRA